MHLAPTPSLTLPAPLAPSITSAPAVTAVAAARHALLRRNTTYGYSFSYSHDNCYTDLLSMTCDSAYVGCLESADGLGAATDYAYGYSALDSSLTACYCTYGLDYLNCYYDALASASCYSSLYLSTDWASYELYWFQQSCGTVPAKIGAGPTTADEAVP